MFKEIPAALDRKIALDLAPSKSEKQDDKDAKESQGEDKKASMSVAEPSPDVGDIKRRGMKV